MRWFLCHRWDYGLGYSLCLFPCMIKWKNKGKLEKARVFTKWKCARTPGWVSVSWTDWGANGPPRALQEPQQWALILPLGEGNRSWSCFLPGKAAFCVYKMRTALPVVRESPQPTSAFPLRRQGATSPSVGTTENTFSFKYFQFLLSTS